MTEPTATEQLAAALTRAEHAEAALAALHQGEDPHLDDSDVPTPGQWIWRWNRATPAERLDAAAYVISQGAAAYQCVMENHPVRLAALQQRFDDEHATAVARAHETDRVRRELRAAETRIAAARAVLDRYLGCASNEAALLRMEIREALDGPADIPTSPAVTLSVHVDGEWQAVPGVAAVSIDREPVTEAGEQLAAAIGRSWPPFPDVRARVAAALATAPSCCVCGSLTHGGRKFYENYQGRLFCWPCADGRQPTCPLGDQCDGVDCPRRADHGPRPAAEPERPAGWCPTCEGQPRWIPS